MCLGALYIHTHHMSSAYLSVYVYIRYCMCLYTGGVMLYPIKRYTACDREPKQTLCYKNVTVKTVTKP